MSLTTTATPVFTISSQAPCPLLCEVRTELFSVGEMLHAALDHPDMQTITVAFQSLALDPSPSVTQVHEVIRQASWVQRLLALDTARDRWLTALPAPDLSESEKAAIEDLVDTRTYQANRVRALIEVLHEAVSCSAVDTRAV